MMEKTMKEFPAGSWERPDAGGIVRRGEAVSEFTCGYKEEYGEAPHCFALHEFGCERKSVMEVYGLHFCEAHGEEAAMGALEEIRYDLERRISPDTTGLEPHVEQALRLGMESLPDSDGKDRDEGLRRAYPFEERFRDRVEAETGMYVEERLAGRPRLGYAVPYDLHIMDAHLISRHMRLAFEDGATWMIEMLEPYREDSAFQAAWALWLEEEAGL
jgi:hypothetical protein